MASALRFAARKICGRAFQRPAGTHFTAAAEAAVREEQRRLFPSISHGRSSVRRFCSSESQNLMKNNKNGPNSAAVAAESSRPTDNTEPISPPPLWSPRNKWFYPLAAGYLCALAAAGYATICVETRLHWNRKAREKEQRDALIEAAGKKQDG